MKTILCVLAVLCLVNGAVVRREVDPEVQAGVDQYIFGLLERIDEGDPVLAVEEAVGLLQSVFTPANTEDLDPEIQEAINEKLDGIRDFFKDGCANEEFELDDSVKEFLGDVDLNAHHDEICASLAQMVKEQEE